MGNVFELRRELLTDNSSSGLLLEPSGIIICKTLEDTDRDLNMNGELEEGKIYGQTAIPYGLYKLVMKHSPKFNRVMPYIDGVKTHTGVMIHSGNRPADSLGCVLVGDISGEDFVGNSKATFEQKVFPTIAKYLADNEELFIQVTKSQTVKDRRSFTKV